ncbi:UNVERIFIED_CONTAM: hypothetical protein Sradi_5472100 [Sesamum radiatum]|uniref:Uncharacterized protein n=1 Tax=Sesamum radiatum TaxID=300843 RepID=A0AAW2LBI4_SESRA
MNVYFESDCYEIPAGATLSPPTLQESQDGDQTPTTAVPHVHLRSAAKGLTPDLRSSTSTF